MEKGNRQVVVSALQFACTDDVPTNLATAERYTGVVTGISEMDPVRWSGSKWRCLLVWLQTLLIHFQNMFNI
ncbi:hypothetical protein ES319_D02G134300v1 [Gossypium barbadense]|uniref:Auxin response factor domain-containing protein n=1 Tax=Gossypium barbadense TaxID=3634 RepID=A0A5J5SCV8_GOSBA|nr:hypothetical protein ES319_D02G134300v1 [Gossypium barbadense]